MNSQLIQSTTVQYAQAAGQVGQTAIATYTTDLPVIETIAVFIAVILFVGVAIIITKIGWLSYRVNRFRNIVLKTDMSKIGAQKAWAGVQKHFFAGDDNDLKIAIIDADNIMNDALRYAGIRGGNLGERLKTIKKGQIPNLEDLWQAHKLRNEIAHETNFKLKRDATEKALHAYETALKNLGVFES